MFIERYKDGLIVCGDEEREFMENDLSPFADFIGPKMITWLPIQNGWYYKYLDFEIAFPLGCLDRSVYKEVRNIMSITLLDPDMCLGGNEAFMVQRMRILFETKPYCNISIEWIWKKWGQLLAYFMTEENFLYVMWANLFL